MAEKTSQQKTPYKGSCHCGHIKYTALLALPPHLEATPKDRLAAIRIRKCNCSTCHKMSFFHVRLTDSPNDFLLLSPLDPEKDLSDYTCFEGRIHWYFCGKCGVRCFAFAGQGDVREVEVEGKKVQAWTPKAEGWVEGEGGYLSVNATTLEPGQEGLDLGEWTEKGWIEYLDCLDETEEARMGKPHRGGIF